ncbi:MAG: hypothetical protein PHO12_02860 [Bacteroidales bacterium]|nr:hypothetical protein [Bacteroidales bacterium]MDD4684332.1 hypothetical protein [Bacteroidales bacterium]
MIKEQSLKQNSKISDLKERGLVLDKILALISQASKLVNDYEEYLDSSSAITPKGNKTRQPYEEN